MPVWIIGIEFRSNNSNLVIYQLRSVWIIGI
jgi:hypothetical protein